MRTFQQKVIEYIANVILDYRLEPVMHSTFANGGKISIQNKDEIGELGHVRYNFQPGTYTLGINFAGKDIPSQEGRNDYFDFYLEDGDREGFNQFAGILRKHLQKYSPK